MGVTADRLAEAMRVRGVDQSALAEAIGATQGAISKILQGHTANSRLIPKIAVHLGYPLGWLLGASDNQYLESPALMELQKGDPDDVELDSVDLAYGMGGTFLDAGDPEIERVKFSREWLRNFTESPPEVLGIAQGIGDSMEPVLYDRDIVIFDRSARLQDHVSDKIWVFAFGQVGMIKRLRPMPDGTVKIMSANRTYPDELATDGDLHVIGRVVASVRRH